MRWRRSVVGKSAAVGHPQEILRHGRVAGHQGQGRPRTPVRPGHRCLASGLQARCESSSIHSIDCHRVFSMTSAVSQSQLQWSFSLLCVCMYGAGDINAVFLLLNWGANPNSVDRAGDSPLLWLVRTCCESRSGQQTNLEIIKLLIRFGANPTYQNQVCRSYIYVLCINLNMYVCMNAFISKTMATRPCTCCQPRRR